MREGDPGDDYVLIESGEAEVSRFGQVIGVLGPGEGLGEIALLHDVPRTASVMALSPISAFSLDRESFLEAVTGTATSYESARTIASERLAADGERDA
jgi:CRP-like cAMP-binding protein